MQGTLEKAVAKVTGQHVRILASGRTDAGVHALGQVVGFRTDSTLPPDVLLRAINANLPHDIAVLDAAEAPEGFHPICHAVRKRYRYTIHDGPVRDVFRRHFAWHYVYGRLDAEAMQPGRRRRCWARTTSAASRAAERNGRRACERFSTFRSSGAGQGDCRLLGRQGSSQVRGLQRRLHHDRSRGRRVSLQHGSHDRRHAGRSGPRQPAGELARRGTAAEGSPRRRTDRAAARALPGAGRVLRRIKPTAHPSVAGTIGYFFAPPAAGILFNAT